MAKKDISLLLITLIDKGDMALIKGRVLGGVKNHQNDDVAR